jgi:amidophosphoribosyltransferase
LFGVFGHPEAAFLTHLGLYAQQHRGQESAGICTTDGLSLTRHVGMGLVNGVFNRDILARINNPVAIGHVRYSTAGSSCENNAQPLQFSYLFGEVALAHNGTLVNAQTLRREFEGRGSIFQTSSDSEVIVHLIAQAECRGDPEPLETALNQLQGAYSLLFLHRDRIVAVRDPLGFRPLCFGRMENGAIVVASETCALDIVDAEYVRDVEPGEILTFDDSGIHSRRFGPAGQRRGGACVFEHVYFADPSSNIFGQNVHVARKAMGKALAREAPVDADLVIPVPNCARCAAIGYSEYSGIPVGRGFTTSHFAGRSFILPEQSQRDLTVKLKLNVIKEAVQGKRLVVVEDSVVRGTTTRGKLSALRKAHAREIHLRVASPPLKHACYYGIDFPDPNQLVANGRSVEEVRKFLGVDSLHYLSPEGMLSCLTMPSHQYCTACFTGDYPTATPGQEMQIGLGRIGAAHCGGLEV